MKGRRKKMEDRIIRFDDLNELCSMLKTNVNRALYAVYDGHSGDEVSEMISTMLHQKLITELIRNSGGGNILELMRKSIYETDIDICFILNEHVMKAGSTVAIAMITGEDCYVANLGDSEVLLGRRLGVEDNYDFKPVVLTFKHNPDVKEEKLRIERGGGTIAKGRLYGNLAISRAMGDSEFKKPKVEMDYISRDPYLNHVHLTEQDQFIVISCDGLYEKLNYNDIIEIVVPNKEAGKTAAEVAEILAQTSYDKGSEDNISVIVIYLNWV